MELMLFYNFNIVNNVSNNLALILYTSLLYFVNIIINIFIN